MTVRVSAFNWVPPFAQGLVRDLRVRWAIHEAGREYDELLIGFQDQSSKEYRRLQPFGQVPAYQEDDLNLFESGAIVLHISETCPQLLPH
jgi:glutathione S-transferase